MTRFEKEYYADINSIAKTLDRIANALENNNKVNEGPFTTASDNTIYYKTRRDMYMDNPCTKEEYEAEQARLYTDDIKAQDDALNKANNIPGFEGTLDALDGLCNIGTNPKNDPERDKFEDDNDLRETARMYTEELEAGNFKTKKDCILDYVTNEFGSHGARYTDVIKFAYYLGAPNAPKFNNSNRGYYSCALTHGRWNTGHLVTGGKDQLVKGINKEGNERYFALSFVESVTDYYKRLDQ